MTFDLVLVGFGNVGRRFVRLLDQLRPSLASEHEVASRIVAIATGSHGRVFDGNGLDAIGLAADADAGRPLGPMRGSTMGFLRDVLRRCASSAHRGHLVVVESTTLDVNSGRPAIDHVRAALEGGAHVITPNKGPVAFEYHTLVEAARAADRCLRFESIALDGVPLFNLREAGLPAVTVTGFSGVVNSTTNYILTAIEQGESFEGALAAMQRAGIAEADPTLDIEGWDAAAKTAAIANVFLDARLTPQSVDREGLSSAVTDRVRSALDVGRRLKLVASAERTGDVVRGRVRLVELPETDLLAQLEGQQNALVLQTDLLGEIAVVQRGTGLTPTAYGMISDLVAVSRQVRISAARLDPPLRATPPRPRRAPGDRSRPPRGRR